MAIKIGQRVQVKNPRSGLSDKVKAQLEQNPSANVAGYRVVDGSAVGIVVKFDSGLITWFFQEELDDGNS
jgi:hypothetical protein